ncbi:transcriptional regulator [Antarcticibacterium flavum]|uniref:Transcriptional regulator n=1 Tax=Antarcticibacterium flavum TaxID=2058175 RepID=A0A5B7X2E9_9FLAO|nr:MULTISPECIES: transcriptional regulator [Antarcticibacterium]MCM4160175.1 transcriptional regulator [Antarcticibacterium sp. W02-3]QCY69724.1 transcriptional regulator [Antarcticibacterium flavum]
MTKSELRREKMELIEQMGVLFEKENLAPLAARIFATVILTGKQGITFDELVNDLNTSKSTVSTHLEYLQATNRVQYFTKTGDRKRYFTINPSLMVNVLDDMLVKWESQKNVHEKVLVYKKKHNELAEKEQGVLFDLEFQRDYLTFLNEATTSIQKLKEKISQRNL